MPLIRPARLADATGMSAVLQELARAGLRNKSSSPAFTLTHYIAHPDRISCLVAIGPDDQVLGFQSLKRATPGNPYCTPVGWGIIGTHIHPRAIRQGIGKVLFPKTKSFARLNTLPAIEAGIGAKSTHALAYYEAMGFRTYKTEPGIVYKSYALTGQPLHLSK